MFVLECRVFQPTYPVRNAEKIRRLIIVIRRGQIKCVYLKVTGNLSNRCVPHTSFWFLMVKVCDETNRPAGPHYEPTRNSFCNIN